MRISYEDEDNNWEKMELDVIDLSCMNGESWIFVISQSPDGILKEEQGLPITNPKHNLLPFRYSRRPKDPVGPCRGNQLKAQNRLE